MRKLFLADGIHVCAIDGGAVFLDLNANRYLAVPPEAAQALNYCLEGFSAFRPDAASDPYNSEGAAATIDSLVARQVLTASKELGHPAELAVSHAARALPPGRARQSRRRIRTRHVAAFLESYGRVLLGLRLKRLPRLISYIRASNEVIPAGSQPNLERLPETLEIFRLIRTFVYTAKEACLLDSLVLANYLRFFAFAPHFFIGVRTKPFLAHAWVEVGDYVVDDRIESLKGLTPILVA